MSKPYLKFLDVYYGAKCNLACDFCDTRSDITKTTEFDPDIEIIKYGIDLTLKHYDIEKLGLLGGEPLLYMDKVYNIIEYVRSKYPNLEIVLSTNGMLLDKKLKEIVTLVNTFKVNIFVCDHTAGFNDKKLSNRIHKHTLDLASELEMKKGNANKFIADFLDIKNSRQDPLFQTWLDKKGGENFEFADGESDDEYYSNNNTFIHFRKQSWFRKNYNIVDGKPKPFMSGDPKKSYEEGCCSEMCSFLYNKKLYKCAALGTLERFLNFHNIADDPDWQKYKNYKALDLESCTQEDVQFFNDTKYCGVSACDMCPSKDERIQKLEFRVLPKNV